MRILKVLAGRHADGRGNIKRVLCGAAILTLWSPPREVIMRRASPSLLTAELRRRLDGTHNHAALVVDRKVFEQIKPRYACN